MSNQDLHVLNGRSAGFVTRLVAFFIDLVIVSGMVALGGWIAVLADNTLEAFDIDVRANLAAVYVVLVPFIIGLYFVMLWSLTGRTFGKSLLGLRVINKDGRPPTIGRSVVRLLGYAVSAIVFWVGYLWVLIDDERQAWHDHFARTWVIYDYTRSAAGETYEGYIDQSQGSS